MRIQKVGPNISLIYKLYTFGAQCCCLCVCLFLILFPKMGFFRQLETPVLDLRGKGVRVPLAWNQWTLLGEYTNGGRLMTLSPCRVAFLSELSAGLPVTVTQKWSHLWKPKLRRESPGSSGTSQQEARSSPAVSSSLLSFLLPSIGAKPPRKKGVLIHPSIHTKRQIV